LVIIREVQMPQTIRAIVVDRTVPGRLAIKPVELRDPDRDEVQVKVTAISLNRGETRRAVQQAEPGWRPGWDFAGVVETAAADGSGPKAGMRVVGILPNGAWAERVNCRSHAVAALPGAVSDAQAATLPVAGLTALHALRQGGLLLGRKVLVDGASGGVGHLACQLAHAAGALVWGYVRREERREQVARWTGGRVVVGSDLSAAREQGPYWLIVDSVGGSALSAAMGMLAPNGACVTLGISEGPTATVQSRDFFSTGGARLYGLTLFHELMSVERGGIGLALLAGEIAAGRLTPEIAVEAGWSEIGAIAKRLIDRDFTGKAVLHID
jgi:NADPH2:quinone reductase